MSEAELLLLDEVRNARRTRLPLPSRGHDRGVDLDAAYRIQAQLAESRELKGYKLGLLSPAKQAQMGIDHPTFGRIHAEMLKQDVLSLGQFMQPRVEPEVAVALSAPIPPRPTPGQVSAAIGGFFLGLDVLDTVWSDYRFTAAEVVADNTSGGGFILGTRLHSDLPGGGLRLFINGHLRAEGPVSALGNPVERLTFLADSVGGLEGGMTIFLGSPAAAVPVEAGLIEVVSESDCLSVRVEEE
jgi:2-keto-4-pentenoate hydratase